MKKILAFVAFLPSLAAAQLTLEHHYPTHTSMDVARIENEGTKYVGTEISTKKVILYNPDHSIYKSIQTDIPSSVNYFNALYASKLLFDNDNQVEILCYFSSGSNSYTTKIYNEDGTVLQTLNNSLATYVVKVDSNWKLIATDYPASGTSVYSLPGKYTQNLNVLNSGTAESESMLYPNPATTTATIKYQLPAGVKQAGLNVYNVTGAVVRQYQVSSQFSDIIINAGDLPAGTYYYKIDGGTAQAFIIKP